MSEALYEAALRHEGTWEWADGSNPKILKWFKDAGHDISDDATPWCAAFVGAMLAELGLPNTGSLLARSYTKYGEDVGMNPSNWRKGDIMVFWRGSPNGWQAHVAIYAGRHGAGKIAVLGGNQRDGVNIADYPTNRLLAVRRAQPPRQSKVESKTIWAQVAQWAAGGGAGVMAGFGGLDATTQRILAVAGVVIVIAGIIIMRDRIKAWSTKGNR